MFPLFFSHKSNPQTVRRRYAILICFRTPFVPLFYVKSNEKGLYSIMLISASLWAVCVCVVVVVFFNQGTDETDETKVHISNSYSFKFGSQHCVPHKNKRI